MDKNKIKRRIRIEKTIPISLRVPLSASKFMKDNDYSPTAIMIESLRDLGWVGLKAKAK